MFRCILAISLFLTAHASLGHGDLHEQIVAITARIRKSPKDAALYLQRGDLHRAHAEQKAALADYDKAQRLDPKLVAVHLSRGRAMLDAKQSDAAEREFALFLAEHPDHTEARIQHARALRLLGRNTEAAAEFARADATSVEPILDLFIESAANLTETADHRAALTVLERAIERLGPLAVLNDAALEAELALGQTDAALKRLDSMIEAAPRKELLLERKGRILLAAGRSEEGRAAMRAALQEIDALPERHRKLRATAKLEVELHAQLDGRSVP